MDRDGAADHSSPQGVFDQGQAQGIASRPTEEPPMTTPLLFVLICLASYRVWRIVGRDDWPPSHWFRGWLEVHAERTHEAYMTDNGPHWRAWFWGEIVVMVECPWCLGAWASSGAVFVIDRWFVALPLPVVWALAVSCVVGLIGSNLDD